MRAPLLLITQPRQTNRPNTVAFAAAVGANSGAVSSSTLSLMDAFDLSVASIRSKLLRVNLHVGNNLAAAMTCYYFGDGTTDYGTRYDTPTGLLSAESVATGWNGRAYSRASYTETGPDGGLDSEAWGYDGSGYALPTISVSTGLTSAQLGSNNFGFGGYATDNTVSSNLSETRGRNPGFPIATTTQIIGTNSSTKITAKWGSSYAGTDYVQGTASAAAGMIFTTRTSASETGTRSATTSLYLNATQLASVTGNTSFTNSGTTFTYLSGGAFSGIRCSVLTKSLTQSEYNILNAAILAVQTGLSRLSTGRTNVVVLGDSNSVGFGGVYPWWKTTKVNANWSACRFKVRGFNGAYSGLTSDTNGSVGACSSYIDFLKADGTFVTKSIHIICAGTNDLALGTSALTIWNGAASNGMKAFADARAAAAGGNRVVLFTVAPRSDASWSAGKETERLALNVLIRASGYSYVDLDLAIGAPDTSYGATVINAAYFQTDKLHYSDAGNAAIGAYLAAQINPATL